MKRIIIILTALLLPLLVMSQGVIKPPRKPVQQQTNVSPQKPVQQQINVIPQKPTYQQQTDTIPQDSEQQQQQTPATPQQPAEQQPEAQSGIKFTVEASGDYLIFRSNTGVTFKMVRVEGGAFQMGSKKGFRATPNHRVILSSFHIGETEVTQELWEAVMGNNPSYNRKTPNLPVEQVSWNDCQTFISRLNAMTDCEFRLPTEAEWEFAARGGIYSRGYKYSGGNKISSVAWYDGNSYNTTHIVAGKSANELGLYDMSGNVNEWCADWYDPFYYSNSPLYDPQGPTNSSYRVFRGGSRFTYKECCHPTLRSFLPPEEYGNDLGFRLALRL